MTLRSLAVKDGILHLIAVCLWNFHSAVSGMDHAALLCRDEEAKAIWHPNMIMIPVWNFGIVCGPNPGFIKTTQGPPLSSSLAGHRRQLLPPPHCVAAFGIPMRAEGFAALQVKTETPWS